MRYFILFCFLFFSSLSYAIIPSESINTTSIPIIKEETSSKKEIKRQQKIAKKEQRQLKRQTKKLKWQLLKNALKAKKSNKHKKRNKKDRKPIYWASWLSALLGIVGYTLFGIGIGLSSVYFLGALLAIPFGLAAFVLAIKSIRFMKRNPKGEDDTYNRTFSIIFTVIGMYIGIIFLFLFLMLITRPFSFA